MLGDTDLDSGEVVLDPPGEVDFVSGDVLEPGEVDFEPGEVVFELGEVVFEPDEAVLGPGD